MNNHSELCRFFIWIYSYFCANTDRILTEHWFTHSILWKSLQWKITSSHGAKEELWLWTLLLHNRIPACWLNTVPIYTVKTWKLRYMMYWVPFLHLLVVSWWPLSCLFIFNGSNCHFAEHHTRIKFSNNPYFLFPSIILPIYALRCKYQITINDNLVLRVVKSGFSSG